MGEMADDFLDWVLTPHDPYLDEFGFHSGDTIDGFDNLMLNEDGSWRGSHDNYKYKEDEDLDDDGEFLE